MSVLLFERRLIMDLGWVLLGFFGVVLVLAFLHILGRMASERERLARRKRSHMVSLSGDTVTYVGHS